MKIRAMLAIASCMIGVTATADEWRREDTAREVIWHMANLVDYGTTMDAARRNDDAGYLQFEEGNPIIGNDPSPRRVLNAFVIGAIAHTATSYLLPHGWRESWQYLSLATSVVCAENNISIGLRVNF